MTFTWSRASPTTRAITIVALMSVVLAGVACMAAASGDSDCWDARHGVNRWYASPNETMTFVSAGTYAQTCRTLLPWWAQNAVYKGTVGILLSGGSLLGAAAVFGTGAAAVKAWRALKRSVSP